MKLNSKNYFSEKNTYLSTSKIKDYILSPHYYFQKHVLHTIKEDPTDAMLIGTMVEFILNNGMKRFNRRYKAVQRRTGKPNEVTQAMFQMAVSMAERLMGTTAFKELESFKRQVILTSEDAPMPICGTLDFLKVEEEKGRAIIVDLKSAKTTDPIKYFYHAKDLGYYYQCAMYIKLVKHNFKVDKVDFLHLVIEKDTKGIYPVKTFKFSDQIIDEYTKKLDLIIKEISERKDWSEADASFATAEILGMNGVAEPMTESEWETV